MKKTELGLAILPLLIGAIAMASALVYLTTHRNSGQVGIAKSNAVSDELHAQAVELSSKILWCVNSFPDGNNGTSFRVKFPAGVTSVNQSNIACPGISLTSGSLWQRTSGAYPLKSIDGHSSWTYLNNADGVRISITGNNLQAISRAVKKLGPNATQSTFTLTYKIAD